jgi:transcriptional regulator with XRE-family HTH domain
VLRRKKYKRKPYKPIDREKFVELRKINRLSVDQVAKLLQVTSRTVAHWESGVTRIPYSAFKLLRYLASGELLPEAWKGWVIKGDTLWSPVGRPFRQHELTYLTHYFTMARYWQADYERRNATRQEAQIIHLKPTLRLVLGGKHD